mgnify:CR=1 FL=1
MNNTRFYLFSLIFLSFYSIYNLSGQEPPALEWAYQLESKIQRTDDSLNIVSSGLLNGTIDLDLGPDTYELTNNGFSSIFIRKMEENKNFRWAKKIGGSGNSTVMVTDLYIDQSYNIYIFGHFQGTIDFDPGFSTQNLTSIFPNNSPFICKLDQNGTFQWVKKLEVDSKRFAVDNLNNIFITGDFSGTVDFDLGVQLVNLSTSPSSTTNSYIAKYDKDFNYQWVKQFSSIADNNTSLINLDDYANVYITGKYNDSVDFDPSPNTYQLHQDTSLVAPSNSNIYTCKLDSNGNFLWAKQTHSNLSTDISSISSCMDEDQNLYTIGKFDGIVGFNSDSSFNINSIDEGKGIYITKIDQWGNYIFTRIIIQNTNTLLKPNQIVDNGKLYIMGYYSGTIDFAPGAQVETLSGSGGFILKLDQDGYFIWNYPQNHSISNLDVFNENELVLSGKYAYNPSYDPVDFDPTDGQYYLPNPIPDGTQGYYLSKWNQCTTRDSIDVFGCTSYTMPSGNMTYYGSGSYFDTLENNAAGCNHFLKVNLTIGIDETVSVSGDTLKANLDGATYQWMICDNGVTFLPIETNQTFIPETDGVYAVEVTKYGCTEYSACTPISLMDIKENEFENSIEYQNPINDILNIQLKKNFESIDLNIRNIQGQLILNESYTNIQEIETEFKEATGVYFIELISKNGDSYIFKIVKK